MIGNLQEDKTDRILSKVRGLYTIFDAEEAQWKAKRQQIRNFSTLSLFNEEDSDGEIVSEDVYDQERPATPINESVKAAPKTYTGLSKLIFRRINPRKEWTHISEEDQSSLGAVIMGEVNAVWPLIRRQVADPFLNHQQNKELQRRIAVHCVTVCEQLFMHYAEKVKTLNSRGIFTNPANISRIRAQLALDAGKYLNILSVRRHIIADLKKPPAKEQITFNREDVAGTPTSPMPIPSPKELSFRKLVKSSRPRRKMKYQFNLHAEIQSMQTLMPTLSMSKVNQLQSVLEKSRAMIEEDEIEDMGIEEPDVWMDESIHEERDEDSLSVSTIPRPRKHRCPSEPMPSFQSLLEELKRREIEDEEFFRSSSGVPPSRQGASTVFTQLSRPATREKAQSTLGLSKPPPPDSEGYDVKDPREDLKILVAKQEKDRERDREESDESNDLPPLIQAITRKQIQDENLRKLRQKEKELDKKYEEEMAEKLKPLPPPQYPQPPIVQSKLPGISNPVNRSPLTIRASDVKINDRVDLSTVTLQSYLPVYNDLTGDISQATVKELDANLFQGGELREVYTEIMKTVPNVHQQYDNDPLVISPGSNVDLSRILASSTLIRPRSQQVINPKLRKDDHDMPWEGQQISWSKTQHHAYSGYPPSEASTMSQGQGEGYVNFHRFTPSQLNHPGIDKGSRAYASWLQWWKNTINSDDFFKYLSTQDTDFLSVVFHFYDSDAADSETESMRTAKLDAQREREKKLAELKKEKEEYVPGLWNVKSVLFGGLGKDPEIEEEEFSDFGTPRSSDRSHSFSQSDSRSLGHTPRASQSRSGSMNRSTALSSKALTNTSTRESAKQDSPRQFSIQERLEIVWHKLRMPDAQKLNSALKYSTDKYINKLPDIVTSWERVTDLILHREKLMTTLELFEKEASDPNRFFERGHRGSSVARLSEAKTRATLYKKLESLETTIKPLLLSLRSRFSDIVTFDGRPYLDKMEWDKIEMLYYLQQERRCTMLKDHGHSEPLDLFLTHGQTRMSTTLPPLRFTQLPLNNVNLTVPQ